MKEAYWRESNGWRLVTKIIFDQPIPDLNYTLKGRYNIVLSGSHNVVLRIYEIVATKDGVSVFLDLKSSQDQLLQEDIESCRTGLLHWVETLPGNLQEKVKKEWTLRYPVGQLNAQESQGLVRENKELARTRD